MAQLKNGRDHRPQPTNRAKAQEAFRLSNDLHADLIVGTRALQLFSTLVDKLGDGIMKSLPWGSIGSAYFTS
jgi:F0F1-type ATP synthase assembly protein I